MIASQNPSLGSLETLERLSTADWILAEAATERPRDLLSGAKAEFN